MFWRTGLWVVPLACLATMVISWTAPGAGPVGWPPWLVAERTMEVLSQVATGAVTAAVVGTVIAWVFNRRAQIEADRRLELLAQFLEKFAATVLGGDDGGIRIEFTRDDKGRIVDGATRIFELKVGSGEVEVDVSDSVHHGPR